MTGVSEMTKMPLGLIGMTYIVLDIVGDFFFFFGINGDVLGMQRGHAVLQRGVQARSDRDGRGHGEEVEAVLRGFFQKGEADAEPEVQRHQPSGGPEVPPPCWNRRR